MAITLKQWNVWLAMTYEGRSVSGWALDWALEEAGRRAT